MTQMDSATMVELPEDWRDRVEAIENKERIKILEKLKERSWSASELARELGLPPQKVVHHINVLRGVTDLQLKDSWVEAGSFGKVYSVDKRAAEHLLNVVRVLKEKPAVSA